MPRRRRSDSDVVMRKLGSNDGDTGGVRFRAPSSGGYLVKNSDDPNKEEGERLEESLLRDLIAEIVRKCGDDWCLYTKKKDKRTGKRRRLGTHSSKAAAYRQERAIKASGG